MESTYVLSHISSPVLRLIDPSLAIRAYEINITFPHLSALYTCDHTKQRLL